MAKTPGEPPRPGHPAPQPPSISRLASLLQRRPVAAVAITTLAAIIVTAVVTVSVMVVRSGAARPPGAAPSSPATNPAVEAENHVSVFLKLEATQEQTRAIESALRGLPPVKEVRFESRQQAYARFKEQFKDSPDLIAPATPKQFPESFRVTLEDPSGFCEVARLHNQPGVDNIAGAAAITASCQ